MRINTHLHHDVLVIEPKGRLTVETESQFTESVRTLVSAGPQRFALDLADVPYVDSVGLGAIVQAYTSARRRGGDLKLLRAGPRIGRLLTITRLFTVLKNCNTEYELERSFEAESEEAGPAARMMRMGGYP